jgi:hypothetical protein
LFVNCRRSDPTAVSGFSGADAPAKISEDAAGDKVTVTFVSMAKIREEEAARKAQAAAASSAASEEATEKLRVAEKSAKEDVKDPDRQNGAAGSDPSSRGGEATGRKEREPRESERGDKKERRERSRERDREVGRRRDGEDSKRRDRKSRSRSRERGRSGGRRDM